MHKQSFLNLLRQNGRHMTKVYLVSYAAIFLSLWGGGGGVLAVLTMKKGYRQCCLLFIF